MSLSLPVRPLSTWAVRLLSFTAMTVCLVLFSMKLTGKISSLAGCGVGDGCGEVMGSRWSEWFYIPVTLCAAALHFGILVLTLPSARRSLGRTGDQLLAAAAVILAGAAVYFVAILYFNLKAHCPWCLLLHGIGLTVAIIILTAAVQQREAGRGILEAAMLSGFVVIGILAAGQIWGPRPETHLLTGGNAGSIPVPETPSAAPARAAGSYESREVEFFGGAMKFDAAALPILGKPDARFVLVEFFDYTCRSCRDLSGDLKSLQKRWPDVFAVVTLPAPLNRSCNPFLKDSVKDHSGACELAELSLAMWFAKPTAFAEFHDYLMTLPLPITPGEVDTARRKGDTLAGSEALTAALADARVKNQLTANIGSFAKLTTQSNAMPKLLLHSDVMMHGPPKDTDTFLQVMDQQFQISAPRRSVK